MKNINIKTATNIMVCLFVCLFVCYLMAYQPSRVILCQIQESKRKNENKKEEEILSPSISKAVISDRNSSSLRIMSKV